MGVQLLSVATAAVLAVANPAVAGQAALTQEGDRACHERLVESMTAATDTAASKPAASLDLYCMSLVPVPDLQGLRGDVLLGQASGTFGVPVTRHGRQIYDLSIWLDKLPPPDSLGDYRTYVAWATTPRLKPVIKLGEVTEGWNELGPVSLNKFLVLITAESTSDVESRRGALVLRGTSPSMRLRPHELAGRLSGAMRPGPPERARASTDSAHPANRDEEARDLFHRRPPMHPEIQPVEALSRLEPWVTPFLPRVEATPPMARPRRVRHLEDGDTLRLRAERVRRRIRGRTLVMYGYNGQYPGPLIRVSEGAEITVLFRNAIDLPTTVHWHGLRLDNDSDGVPGITQEPVAPGGEFVYRLRFPDAGIYWYHPHFREDIQQDLGLYGNMLVQPRQSDADRASKQSASDDGTEKPDDSETGERRYYNPVNREQVLMLDDLLLSNGGLVPYGEEAPTHAMMGRFGNVLLVNGEPDYRLQVDRGSVVRFFLTNVSNTRTFNISFDGARMKAIASDVGRFEEEEWVENVVLAPAERYVVEARFPEAGLYALVNRVQGIDRRYGRFFGQADTLGSVRVTENEAAPDLAAEFESLRSHPAVKREIERYRQHFDRAPDRNLVLTMESDGIPYPARVLMRADSTYFHPVEWTGTMPIMNWVSTGREVRWIIREPETGRENMAIDWTFRENRVVKIRLRNDRNAFHAMQHPIHLHGQRFLVLSRNGKRNRNLVWKDTMLMPVGSTAEILLELTNPGEWMLHCHISEHLQAGMKTVFTVTDVPDGPEPGTIPSGSEGPAAETSGGDRSPAEPRRNR